MTLSNETALDLRFSYACSVKLNDTVKYIEGNMSPSLAAHQNVPTSNWTSAKSVKESWSNS